jgi:hypothetical protein
MHFHNPQASGEGIQAFNAAYMVLAAGRLYSASWWQPGVSMAQKPAQRKHGRLESIRKTRHGSNSRFGRILTALSVPEMFI